MNTKSVKPVVSEVSGSVNSQHVAKKTFQKTFRFDDDVADAIAELAPLIDTPKLIRELILAAHRFYKTNGRIYLPLELQPLVVPAADAQSPKRRKAS